MTPYSWHLAAQTDAIYLDGQQKAGLGGYTPAGYDIAAMLHMSGDHRRKMVESVADRLERGEPAFDLSHYGAWWRDTIDAIDRKGLHVVSIHMDFEFLPDTRGIGNVERADGKWRGEQPIPGVLDLYDGDDDKAQRQLQDQINEDIVKPAILKFGPDIVVTNFNWGVHSDARCGLTWGGVSCPVLYGGEPIDLVRRLVECGEDCVPWIAASTLDTNSKLMVDLCRYIGVDTVLHWAPTSGENQVPAAVAKADADYIRGAK